MGDARDDECEEVGWVGGDDGLSWNLMPPVVWAGGGQRIEKKSPKKAAEWEWEDSELFVLRWLVIVQGHRLTGLLGPKKLCSPKSRYARFVLVQLCSCCASRLLLMHGQHGR